MTTLKTFIGEKEIEIYNVSTMPASSGHQKITVELSYDGDFKEFSATTSNMPGFDAAMNLEGNEKKHSLYELIESKIINDISYWLESLECKLYYCVAVNFGDSEKQFMQFQSPLMPETTKLLDNASKFDNANQAKTAMVEAEEFAKAAGWENYSFSVYSFEA